MSSFQDLLMMHEINVNNQLQKTAPTVEALNYLSKTVAQKIEKAREEQKQKIIQQKNNDAIIRTAEKNSNAGKMVKMTYNADGGVSATVEDKTDDALNKAFFDARKDAAKSGVTITQDMGLGSIYDAIAAKNSKVQLSPAQEIQKANRTTELFSVAERNKVTRAGVEAARNSLKNITPGLLGKVQRSVYKASDPKNPMYGDWQNIKMVLTDATLLNTAKTKGAISDQEMALFQKAANDDDMGILAGMEPVFNKVLAVAEAEESGLKAAYKKVYGEDPDEFLKTDFNPNFSNQKSPPSVGGVVDYNGIQYRFKGGDPSQQSNWEKL